LSSRYSRIWASTRSASQLAQCDQVALAEEVLDRPLSLVRDVDLAFLESLQQFIGRQVDDGHLVGVIEDGVGNRLPHPYSRDLSDDVVQAFQMLDVDRGEDVDAGVEQLLHVLPALVVSAARDVGMGQFVDNERRGPARQRGVKIEFGELVAAVFDFFRR
jgi:hypothetical protein